MSITATGPFRVNQLAAESLAACALWQTWTGAEDAATARESVFCGQVLAGSASRPMARIVREGAFVRAWDGPGNLRIGTGVVSIIIEADVPEEWGEETLETDEDKLAWMDNMLGTIVEQLETNRNLESEFEAGKSYLAFHASSVYEPYLGVREEEDIDEADPDSWIVNGIYGVIDLDMGNG